MIRERESWHSLLDEVTPERERTLPFSLGEMGAIGGFEQGNDVIQRVFKRLALAAMWRINWKSARVDRGRPFITYNPG